MQLSRLNHSAAGPDPAPFNAAREGLSLLEELAGTKDSRRQGGDRDGYWPGARVPHRCSTQQECTSPSKETLESTVLWRQGQASRQAWMQ
ncbi:hypothetical protein EYF80_002276 [Liparis tanakae]|uniref:Uncharacterized protein n=1 Tax=Liparis tanakae TaxID=230148 RepID=A0A4Z2JBG0_9TELE|nr:hypothetical protein EYF80_002276 [Liparis tanakae]